MKAIGAKDPYPGSVALVIKFWVDKVQDGVAYLTGEMPDKREVNAKIDVERLKTAGISGVGDHFTWTILPGTTEPQLALVPFQPLTREEAYATFTKWEQRFPGHDPDWEWFTDSL
jgi:hypothetical protein